MTLIAAIGVGCLLIPPLVLSAFGATSTGSLAGLGALGIAITTIALGRRVAFAASAALAVMSATAVLTAGSPVVAVILMVGVAIAYGWSARLGANAATVVLPITLGFVVNAQPPTSGDTQQTALMLALAILVTGCLATLATSVALGRKHHTPTLTGVSRTRTIGFIVQLSLTTAITTAISVGGQWGHAGGWMAMTPFIVIQPYVQDGWRKAVRRGAGTIGGFLLAIGFATVLHNTWALAAVGVAFGAGATIAYMRRMDYGIYALLLTPAVVILEGLNTSVQVTAIERLEATLIGVGLSLAAMAIALPLYRRGARAHSLTHY